jgi:AcrR family transcriptional regulator
VVPVTPHDTPHNTPRNTPISRRERPAKPALSREAIVAAAVEIVRVEGMPKLTMRRVAQELDTGAASLYVYVRNTAELRAAVLDELLGTVELRPAKGDWRERLEEVLTSYTSVLFAYPGLAQSALIARPSGKHYIDLVETLLALLDEGGVPVEQAVWGVDLLLQMPTATAVEHADGNENAATQEDWDALMRALRAASPRTHPHIAGLAGELVTGTPETHLSWALRVLINGIAHTPRPSETKPKPT